MSTAKPAESEAQVEVVWWQCSSRHFPGGDSPPPRNEIAPAVDARRLNVIVQRVLIRLCRNGLPHDVTSASTLPVLCSRL